MPTLTYNEGLVIDVIRQRSRHGVPVSAIAIRERLLGQLSYDAANRAMTGLVGKGVAIKPSRGYYLPEPVVFPRQRQQQDDRKGDNDG